MENCLTFCPTPVNSYCSTLDKSCFCQLPTGYDILANLTNAGVDFVQLEKYLFFHSGSILESVSTNLGAWSLHNQRIELEPPVIVDENEVVMDSGIAEACQLLISLIVSLLLLCDGSGAAQSDKLSRYADKLRYLMDKLTVSLLPLDFLKSTISISSRELFRFSPDESFAWTKFCQTHPNAENSSDYCVASATSARVDYHCPFACDVDSIEFRSLSHIVLRFCSLLENALEKCKKDHDIASGGGLIVEILPSCNASSNTQPLLQPMLTNICRHVAKPPVSLSHAHQSSLGPSGDTSAYANGVGLTQVTEHMDHVYAYCVLHMLADGYDVIPQPVSVIESKDGQLNGRFGGYPYKCAVLAWYRHHTMSAPMHTIHTNTTASTATNTTASTATENMKRSCILSGQVFMELMCVAMALMDRHTSNAQIVEMATMIIYYCMCQTLASLIPANESNAITSIICLYRSLHMGITSSLSSNVGKKLHTSGGASFTQVHLALLLTFIMLCGNNITECRLMSIVDDVIVPSFGVFHITSQKMSMEFCRLLLSRCPKGMSWCVDRVIIELIRMSMFYRNGCVDISNATMAQRTAITHAIRELAVGIRRQYVLLWDETMNHLLTDSSGTAFGENRSSKYSEIVEEVRYFKDWIFEGSAKL